MTRAILTWLGLLVVAIVNGGLREAVLVPWLGLVRAGGKHGAALGIHYRHVLGGRTWVMVLVVTLLAPVVTFAKRTSVNL